MPKFKLLEGAHMEGGKTYTKGQIVESPHNLHALFRNKFSTADGATLTADEPEQEEEVTPAPKAKPAAKAKKAKNWED